MIDQSFDTQTPSTQRSGYLHFLETLNPMQYYGHVRGVLGLSVEVAGISDHLTVGGQCLIDRGGFSPLRGEIVGFKNGAALAQPFGHTDHLSTGAKVKVLSGAPELYPSPSWKGRILNAHGEPIDQKGPLTPGEWARPIKGTPIPAYRRKRMGERMDMGLKIMNTFLPCCRGQRMGIFAGSGVGKSTLMAMLARYAKADTIVIGLIGERGREVQDFIQDALGEEGLKRSVLVVATSDESPLMRRQAAYTTMAVAEYFRDNGDQVLCLMDSVTRFAMAQREIGLSVGEPPTTKGFPPTVFTELPKLLERAGPGEEGQGDITAIFSVLVDGGDMDEPIADAVRGILDGHIVLSRSIAERGRFPSIDVLRSVSRSLPKCHDDTENGWLRTARQYMSTYHDMEDLIRIGAYKKGSNPEVDKAIVYHTRLENFLSQGIMETISLEDSFRLLEEALES